MERVAIESSMLRSVGYDRTERVLEAEFTSGRVYRYLEVPPSVYRALMAAESKGSYFGDCIIGCYSYVPVRRR